MDLLLYKLHNHSTFCHLIPNKILFLKDVKEEENEQILVYHRIKLAITFGFLNIYFNTTI